ncbi:MAG TPA: hypothetical protein VHW64_07705 [Nocardioides sp.]|jgi:hypothetical protein|uniref:hypothetical protein n=1 Tax=Nocardioides sp. TaxID=35761 RepID=UPI002E36133C|nr:hypothetical protein [Nocardioides sp.]HEX3930572.1 hypothetical protein [Nocardioides sp.]
MTEPATEPEPVDPGHDPGVDPAPDEETPEHGDGSGDGEGRTLQEALDRVDMVDEQEVSTLPAPERRDPDDHAEQLDEPEPQVRPDKPWIGSDTL